MRLIFSVSSLTSFRLRR